MTVHREQARFVVSIDLSAEFDEDYDGDDDGYVWLERWKASVRPQLVRAVFQTLRSDPAFDAIPVTRGKDPDAEIEIDVRFKRNTRKRSTE
jgi:hypothetical protein